MLIMTKTDWMIYKLLKKYGFTEKAHHYKEVNRIKILPLEKALVKNDGDSVIYKAVIDHNMSEEEKEAYTCENWKNYRFSPYDCTAQVVTSDIKFFRAGNKTFIYHFEKMDI